MKRALLVDDEEIVRDFVGELLGDAGYTVVHAHNGQFALKRLADQEQKEKGFELIVSDCHMPGMGGVELLKHVRANARTANTPFILMSGRDVVSDQDQTPLSEVCAKHSANFIGKPFTLGAFLQLLD